MDDLNRSAAPFGAEIWERIDAEAVSAARAMLTGRRLLEVDGPYGVGLTSLELGNDDFCREPAAGEAGAVLGRAVSVPMLRRGFRLSIRRIRGHLDMGQPLDLAPVAEAAEAVAAREEEFIYYGQADFGLPGLLTADGSARIKAGDWSEIERVLGDVLAAVDALDSRGLRGPYGLALAPALYNGLYRRYEGTELMLREHLESLCTRGIYKAPIEGGVLVDPRLGRLVIGRDLAAGYASQDGVHVHLYLSESLVLKVDKPAAVCVIDAAKG